MTETTLPEPVAPAAPPDSPRPKALSLTRNMSWTLVGNVAYQASQWAVLAVLAKISSPERVGEYALGLAVTGPVLMFSMMKLRAVQATDAKGDYRFGHYLGLRLLATLVALLVIAGLAFFTGYGLHLGLIILLVGLMRATETISDIFFGLYQQRERMDCQAYGMMLRGLASLIIFCGVYYLTRNLLIAVGATTVALVMVQVGYLIPTGRRILRDARAEDAARPELSHLTDADYTLRPFWQWSMLGRLALLTLPLGITVTLNSLYTNVPRYYVQHYQGMHLLGIWCALSYLLIAGSTIVQALGQSASPRLAKYYAFNNRRAFFLLLGKLVGMGFGLGVLGFLCIHFFGRPIICLIYTPEYAEHLDALKWLMVSVGLGWSYVFIGSAVSAMRQFKVQLPIHAVSFSVTLLLSMLLIPRYGLVGAAWAMLGAHLLEAGGYLLVLFMVVRRWTGTAPVPEAPCSVG